jgi:predicted  nucleic acid-binding Zn-ribbon protein
MPHQCVRCSTMYGDGASEILKGCGCGARLFFYINKKHLERAKLSVTKLTDDEKKQIEADVFDLVDVKPEEEERPIVLDFESINIAKPGKYEIDLVHLFKKDPVIFKVGDGKYVIDIQETFRQMKK